MRELNVNEIKAVTGGYWHRLAAGLVSLAFSKGNMAAFGAIESNGVGAKY